jgi:hypothetical protein
MLLFAGPFWRFFVALFGDAESFGGKQTDFQRIAHEIGA